MQYGRKKNTLEDFCFIMDGRNLDHKSLIGDVALFMDESLNWNELVEVIVGMARRPFFRLRISTSPIICTKSKAKLYRSIISMSMLSASECWKLRKTNFGIIEKFNKKILKWICWNLDYKDTLVKSNLLPPLYIKVLKDLLLFSNILDGRYNVDLSKEFNITNSGKGRSVVLPDTRYEIQRQNFWYRKLLSQIILQRINPIIESSISNTLFAYRSGRSTGDVVLAHKYLVAGSLAKGFNRYCVGIDLSKAFDNVWRDKLINILCSKGVPEWDLSLIRLLLYSQTQH